jgi:hypothetical protein
MAFPFTSESFITKSSNQPQSGGTRNLDNVLPLLVALKILDSQFGDLSIYATMLIYLPHTTNSIYTIFSMSIVVSITPQAAASDSESSHEVAMLPCLVMS